MEISVDEVVKTYKIGKGRLGELIVSGQLPSRQVQWHGRTVTKVNSDELARLGIEKKIAAHGSHGGSAHLYLEQRQELLEAAITKQAHDTTLLLETLLDGQRKLADKLDALAQHGPTPTTWRQWSRALRSWLDRTRR